MIHDALRRRTYSISAADLVTLLRTLDPNLPEGSQVTSWNSGDRDDLGAMVFFHVFHESIEAVTPGEPEPVTEL